MSVPSPSVHVKGCLVRVWVRARVRARVRVRVRVRVGFGVRIRRHAVDEREAFGEQLARRSGFLDGLGVEG